MLRSVLTTLRRREFLQRGDHVLAAVSGGADSVAMLLALHDLAPRLGLRLSVAHLDHGIRGREAREDAAFVRRLAAALGLPCETGRARVPALAARHGISIEMAAREARYRFLDRAARRLGATCAATAHTADDQAETVLLRLCRGAGPRGLAGIPPESTIDGLRVVRPLIDTRRSQVEAFLKARGQAWREDRTNRETGPLRNRVRAEVLPAIRRLLNPRVDEALGRTADLLREEDALIEQAAGAAAVACQTPDGLAVEGLRALAPALRRRVLRRAMVQAGLPEEMADFAAVDAVDRLLAARRGAGRICLPGAWQARRQAGIISFSPGGGPGPAAGFRRRLRTNGETALPEAGLRVTVRRSKGVLKQRGGSPGDLPAWASLDAAAVGRRPLVLRSWQPGDRMRPLGLAGTKKLQDIFVDAKVPADRRTGVPVLECGGEIVWIPRYRVARGWEVPAPDAPALHVRIAETGETG